MSQFNRFRVTIDQSLNLFPLHQYEHVDRLLKNNEICQIEEEGHQFFFTLNGNQQSIPLIQIFQLNPSEKQLFSVLFKEKIQWISWWKDIFSFETDFFLKSFPLFPHYHFTLDLVLFVWKKSILNCSQLISLQFNGDLREKKTFSWNELFKGKHHSRQISLFNFIQNKSNGSFLRSKFHWFSSKFSLKMNSFSNEQINHWFDHQLRKNRFIPIKCKQILFITRKSSREICFNDSSLYHNSTFCQKNLI